MVRIGGGKVIVSIGISDVVDTGRSGVVASTVLAETVVIKSGSGSEVVVKIGNGIEKTGSSVVEATNWVVRLGKFNSVVGTCVGSFVFNSVVVKMGGGMVIEVKLSTVVVSGSSVVKPTVEEEIWTVEISSVVVKIGNSNVWVEVEKSKVVVSGGMLEKSFVVKSGNEGSVDVNGKIKVDILDDCDATNVNSRLKYEMIFERNDDFE